MSLSRAVRGCQHFGYYIPVLIQIALLNCMLSPLGKGIPALPAGIPALPAGDATHVALVLLDGLQSRQSPLRCFGAEIQFGKLTSQSGSP